MEKKIGEMNGRWAILFKTVLVVIPVVNAMFIPWAVWVTTTLWEANFKVEQFQQISNEITRLVDQHQKDSVEFRQELKEIDARLDDAPPAVWKDRILALEADSRRNAEDHLKILLNQERQIMSLEQIQQKLGVVPVGVADK